MANCLVTKLKEVVNNDKLEILNAFKITVPSGNQTFYIQFEDVIRKRFILKGDGYFSDSTYTQNLGNEIVSYGNIYISANESCTLIVYDNYKLSNISFYNSYADISFLDERNIKTLEAESSNNSLSGVLQNKESFKNTTLFNIGASSNLEFDFSIFSENTVLTRLVCWSSESGKGTGNLSDLTNKPLTQFSSYSHKGIIGNIETFGSIITLTNISIVNCNNITGTIESVCEQWIRNGKTSNLTRFECNTSTLNSSIITDVLTIDFESNTCSIKKSGNTIAYYNGSTWSYS